MLPLILIGRDETSLKEAMESAIGFIAERPGGMSLALQTASFQKAQRYIEEEVGILALVVEFTSDDLDPQGDGARLMQTVYEQNRDSYIVCCLREGASPEKCLDVCMRPAGMMSAPPDREKLRSLFHRILDDYERISANPGCEYLMLHAGNTSYRLPLSLVLYIEALDKKLNIWTQRQCITLYETLRSLEARLGPCFVKCHRSYLVNIETIEQVDYGQMRIRLTNGDSIPLSRSNRDELRTRLIEKGDGRS